jgi:ribose transport system ATP-binding protein
MTVPPPESQARSSKEPVLQACGVTKTFAAVRALRDVDLSLYPGEIHTLVGENGAGKSTLIKVLTGVYRCDSGELRLDGQAVEFATPSEAQVAGISTIYQEVNLVPLLSVARNIFLGREPRSRFGLVDISTMNRRAAEVVKRLGIEVDVTGELGRLGLGVQQMIALARAVSTQARVVIMDEPTSSLEAREVETLFAVARRLRDDGVALVFVSHRLDELWALCDRVTIMRDGAVVHSGAMADLNRSELVAHMLGRDPSQVDRDGATSFGESHLTDRPPTLRVRGLCARHRVNAVDIEVRPGEVVGLGGLLGSGRSEAVKAIYGGLSTQAGEVEIDGKQVRRGSISSALRNGIALLSEDRKAEGIIPELSVRDNIALAVLPNVSSFGVVSEKKIDDLVETFIRRLNIKASSPDQKARDLSGGNQQKVLLARWLCTEPKIFLLDEPTRGIDVGAKLQVQELIDELARKGLGVVLISSEMEELVEGADRVIVLRDGAVSEEITKRDLTTSSLLAALAGDKIRELVTTAEDGHDD